MHQNEINMILEEVIKEAKSVGIPISDKIDKHVYINPRPKRRFGCCKTMGGTYIIEISKFLLDGDMNAIRGVIAHEVLHTAKNAFKHNDAWKSYADIMNKTYEYNIKRVSKLEEMGLPEKVEVEKINYIIRCKKCGKEYPRRRVGKVANNISDYRCTCGGELEICRPDLDR